jgi:hypothetical protein
MFSAKFYAVIYQKTHENMLNLLADPLYLYLYDYILIIILLQVCPSA